jgi:hypothetical protein
VQRASKVTVINRTGRDKDVLKWKWGKGPAISLDDFGDPVGETPQYSLCVYDSSEHAQALFSAALVPGRTCGNKSCWRASGTTSMKFSDKAGFPGGIQKLVYKAGPAGKGKITLLAKGQELALPRLPATAPLTIQLVANNGMGEVCWGATYAVATKSSAEQLKASSD